MGSFMLKDGVLNSVEHAISFDLNRRSAYPLVLAKSTSVTVNGGDRKREGRR
jgi:hypothetical protein